MQDLEKCQFLALLREFEWFSFLTILFSTFLSFGYEFWLASGWQVSGVAVRVGVTCLAALRSYTLFGLNGCIVKFSFLVTFSAKLVICQKDITIVPLLYCSTKQHPPLTR